MEAALEAAGPGGGPAGPLQAHRALPCNIDDWLRMCAVPVGVEGASFRHMPGVRTWEDGARGQGAGEGGEGGDARPLAAG